MYLIWDFFCIPWLSVFWILQLYTMDLLSSLYYSIEAGCSLSDINMGFWTIVLFYPSLGVNTKVFHYFFVYIFWAIALFCMAAHCYSNYQHNPFLPNLKFWQSLSSDIHKNFVLLELSVLRTHKILIEKIICQFVVHGKHGNLEPIFNRSSKLLVSNVSRFYLQ